jgi:hypothetical protein
MACITKKLRGYGLVAMMMQIPIVAVQRTRLFRGKPLFNVGLSPCIRRMGVDDGAEHLFLDIYNHRSIAREPVLVASQVIRLIVRRFARSTSSYK